jgi:hypothetical protein
MESPCPRCGTLKTESVRHGFIHDTLWNLGYHLRRCSFCDRKRLFKRMDPNRPHPDDLTVEELRESFNRKIAESRRKDEEAARAGASASGVSSPDQAHAFESAASESSIGVAEATEVPESPEPAESTNTPEWLEENPDYQICPKCGGSVYRRSHRRWYERLLKRPKMARCMKCKHRFPYPR